MSGPRPSLFGDAFRSELREIFREVIREEVTAHNAQPAEKDRLLIPEEAATILGQNVSLALSPCSQTSVYFPYQSKKIFVSQRLVYAAGGLQKSLISGVDHHSSNE